MLFGTTIRHHPCIAAFGFYRHQAGIEEGVDALKTAGFRNTDISVLVPENIGSKDLAHEKNTKAPKGAAAGPLPRTRGAIRPDPEIKAM